MARAKSAHSLAARALKRTLARSGHVGHTGRPISFIPGPSVRPPRWVKMTMMSADEWLMNEASEDAKTQELPTNFAVGFYLGSRPHKTH